MTWRSSACRGPSRATAVGERPESARIALPRTPTSVGTARRFIAARTAAWSFPEPAAGHLVLIGSELVTNAVLHARTELTLTLELRDDRVRISVKDRSKAPATLRHYRPDALTGRGLGVVAALSDRWGVSTAPDGKVVWAELQANGQTHAPHPADPGRPAGHPDPAGPNPRGPAGPVPRRARRRLPGAPSPQRRPVPGAGADQHRARGRPRRRGRGPPGRPRGPAVPPVPGPAGQLPRRGRRRPGRRPAHGRAGHHRLARRRRRGQGYLALLEQADELCRAGVLLTPEPPASVKALRSWFVDQMAAQVLHGATPTTPPG